MSTDSNGTFRLVVATAVALVVLVTLAPGTAGAAHQIDSCADDVNSPGLHVVNSSISDAAASSCIDINANNVVLEGQDNMVDGVDDDTGSVGVDVVGRTNVTVRNLTVTNWDDGVLYDGSDNGSVTRVDANGNGENGIRLRKSSNDNSLSDNTANENGNDGILVTESNGNDLISNNVESNDDDGVNVVAAEDTNITGNTALLNSDDGIILASSSNNEVIGNDVSQDLNEGIELTDAAANDEGFGTTAPSSMNDIRDNTVVTSQDNGIELDNFANNNTVLNNTVSGSENGIELDQGANDNDIVGNNVSQNNANGILLTSSSGNNPSDNNNLTDNTANNNDGYGIWIEYGNNNILTGNTANNNGADGIYLGSVPSSEANGNTLVDNTANSNGGEGGSGIYLMNADDNTLVGNTANDNGAFGIWLVQSEQNDLTDNVAENNPVAGVYLGGNINFGSANDNTLVNNTARGSEYGIWVRNSRNNDISESLAENNQVGIEFAEDNFFTAATLASSGNTFTNDTSKNNTEWDFVIETDDPFFTCPPFCPLSTSSVSDLPVTNLNIGDSTNPNTLLSFDGDDVQIRSNTTPPSPPAGLVGIGRYFEAESLDGGNNGVVPAQVSGFLDMTVSYNDTDFAGNESELGLYGYNATTGLWGLLPTDVDEANNTASAQIVEFSTFGILEQARNPFFDVEITGTNSPVLEGQKVNVDADVTNTGNDTATQIIQLDIDGLVVDSEEVTLAPGETASVTLMWNTRVGDAGRYTARVSSDDDNDTAPIRVTETCIDRRDLGRGQEASECPFDRTVTRGGSREELDRNTGRGGGDEHRDSATSRRNRGRGSTRGGR